MAPNTDRSRNNDVDEDYSLTTNNQKHIPGISDALMIQRLMQGRKHMISLLLEKGNRVIQARNSNSPLQIAVDRMGFVNVVKKLISLGAEVSEKNLHGDTALHLAFVNEASDADIDTLLAKYLNETSDNVKNNNGLSFFHISCTRATIQFVQVFIDRGVENIDCQVDLHSRSRYAGFSPLHFAVHFNKYEIAKLLLSNKASIYIQDCSGSTPVHLAVYTRDQKMINLLLAYDERRENCINHFGLTHFMAACAGSKPDIAEAFLHRTPMTYNRVIARVTDVDGEPYAGYTPINFAIHFGNDETARLLVDYGASPPCLTNDKSSPVTETRYSCRKDIFEFMELYAMREKEFYCASKMCGQVKWPKF